MTPESSGKWRPRFRCSDHEVLEAFRATAAGIRSLLQDAEAGLSQEKTPYLTNRLYEQRELIRQVMKRKKWKHVRKMVRIHHRQRDRFFGIAQKLGLDVHSLALQCRTHVSSFVGK